MSCGEPKFISCGNGSMPADFCCGPETYCIPLARDTTLLCCPQGQSCSVIRPIVCDVNLQNSTAHPDATLRTTNLSGTLPTCGTLCCPFGYTCQNSKMCVMDADQNNFVLSTATTLRTVSTSSVPSSENSSQQSAAPTSNSRPITTVSSNLLPDSSAPSSALTSITSSPKASFVSSAAISSNSASELDNCKSHIILGLSLALGLLLSLLIIWFLFMRGRRKRRLQLTRQVHQRLQRAAVTESIRLQSIEAEFPIPPKAWETSPGNIRRTPVAAGFREKSKVWGPHVGVELFELPATPVYVGRSRSRIWPSPSRKSYIGGKI